MINISRHDHGKHMECKIFLFAAPSERSANEALVYVNVPATSVTLSPSINDYIREHSSQTFTCITSACRPFPRVQWYLRNSKGEVLYNLTQFSSITYVNREYGLKAVESTLNFQLNRTITDFRLYCEVWTQVDDADIRSREMLLNFTYPPDNYPKIEGIEKNSKLEILESDIGYFVGSVTGGNPLASLSWNCFGSNDTTIETHGNIVTNTVKWKAHRNYKTCSCTAYHMSDWIRVTNKTIDVQFPTEIRIISSNSVRETVVINQTDNATLTCVANANPTSNISIENPEGDNILEKSYSNIARHTLWNVSYLDAGLYTCRGRNRYTRGLPASSQLTLIVKSLGYLDVPNKTIFKWFKGIEHLSAKNNKNIIRSEELQTNLSIRNTTDEDLGLYRVSVRNSVGEYNHYYVLNAAATTLRCMETVASKNIGEFLGVGAGASLSTLVVVALIVIGYKRAKKVKITSRTGDKQGNIIDHQPSVSRESQVFSAYAELDKNKKEVNEYDTVNVPSTSFEEQIKSTQEGASAYIEMKDARQVAKDTKEYINITI